MPKLSYYQKKDKPTPLDCMEDKKYPKKVLEAIHAIEMHMALSCIAMGIAQSISICFIGKVSSNQNRSISEHLPKEGYRKSPLCTISKNIFYGL